MKKIFFSIASIFICSLAFAQAPVSLTSSEMFWAIKKLNVLGSVLYIAAHPDDENTRLLTYLSKEKLYRTGYLSLTRGDGGQNLIGEEQGVELGLIRTQELLSARRIDGAEQFFTRAYDFGYSKTPTETFSKWGKEKILSDVVWVIRKFQPDVIICRFPTSGEGGHGHHTASAILAEEAFQAAADPTQFSDQLKYVKPWKAKRLLWNTFNFSGGTNTIAENQFKIDVGGYNPILGKSYGEIAAESRSQHKSQGFGVARTRGESFEHFKTISGEAPTVDLFDNMVTDWSKIIDGASISKMINTITTSFDLLHPELSVKPLVQLYKKLNNLSGGNWKQQKENEVLKLIEQCSGLWMDVYCNEPFAVQTDSLRFNFQINNRQGIQATVISISIEEFDSSLQLLLARNKNINISKTIYIPKTKPITQPYWLEKKMEEGSFNVSHQLQIGQPDVTVSFIASITVNIEGEAIKFSKPVQYKFTDPVKGELYNSLIVTPSILIAPDEKMKMSNAQNQFDGVLNLVSKKNSNAAVVKETILFENDKPSIEFPQQQLFFPEKNRTQSIVYKVNANKNNEYLFEVMGGTDSTIFHNTIKEINYDHIPSIHYFEKATVINKKLNLKIAGKRIGYIHGAGDKVPKSLQQMGYEVVFLGDKELSKNNLQQFDAIVTGVRAYNTNDWLPNHYNKLMQYVEEGGNLIVQYNTNNFISKVASNIGPFGFTISRNRITDENSPVVLLKPDHQVFNFPNQIVMDDFKGWVQERSIYNVIGFDKKYESVLSMNDPNEKSDEGSLVIAKHGKGTFVYSGLVFFRQLPAGVSGAYRLFANILALNQMKAF